MSVRLGLRRHLAVTLVVIVAAGPASASVSAVPAAAVAAEAAIFASTSGTRGATHPIAPNSHVLAGHETYQDGDLLISTFNDVQWRLPDGTLNLSILPTFNGGGGLGFGADGSLYLTEFTGNQRIEKYDFGGRKVATYNLGTLCQDPPSIVADSIGNLYIGSGGNLNCSFKKIRKWGPTDTLIADFTPVSDAGFEHGPGWLAMEPDNCTIRYATGLTTIRRYNVCTSTQLSNFSNGLSVAHGLQILPDGGMLVANWSNIVRLNASGQVVQTYDAPGEKSWFTVALDVDGTSFWAGSIEDFGGPTVTNIARRFDVASGAELAAVSTGPNGGITGHAVYDANRFAPPSVPAAQTLGGLVGGGAHGARPYAFISEPVNTATGSYVSEVTDFALPGRGRGLAFTRTYNSADGSAGVLGQGWTHNYFVRTEVQPDGSVWFFDEGGAQLLFAPDGSGGFDAPVGNGDKLIAVAEGHELTRRDQVVYTFDATGQLVSLADRNGNSLTFAYTGGLLTAITDTVGRVVDFTYTDGRLTGLSGPPSRSVTYGYDPNGRLATVTDVRGEPTSYTYDPAGRLATIVDPNNHTVVSNTYGPDGRVTEQIDARDFHSTYEWDPAMGTSTMTDARGGEWVDVYHDNVLVSRSDPLGNLTRFVYDDALNVIIVTDPRGNPTAMTYDANHNMLTRTKPGALGNPEVWTYNGANDVVTYRDGRGFTTTNQYDPAGNLTKTIAPLSSTTEFGRDPVGTGWIVSVKDPRNKTTLFAYDTEANREGITTPLGNVTTMTYDPAGRMLTLVEPRGNVVGADPAQYTSTFTYDEAGNLLTMADPLGNDTVQTYDPVGNALTVSDANEHQTTYVYDEANHLISVTDARTGVTGYGYDEVGNLVSRTDANLHLTTYAYDLAGQPTSTTDPLSHVWSTTYDAAGNIATRTDANNKTTTFTYDVLNRLTNIAYADSSTPAVAYSYDENGNRASITDAAGLGTYAYDALNRLTATIRGADDFFTFGYDLAGNVTSRTYPGQPAQTFVYDDDGRLTSAKGSTYTYDPAANLLTATTPDGVTARTAYDRAGRLLETAHTRSTGTLSRFTYGLDPAGNRVAMTTRQGTVTYRYDELDRLTEACWSPTSCPGGPPTTPLACISCIGSLLSRSAATTNPLPGETYRTYTYDAVGNRLTEASNAGSTTYVYDLADRLVSTTAPGNVVTSYSFNNNGNQTAAGARTFTYDLADRLKTATVGTTTETYTYDGDGVRQSASTGSQANKTTKFFWDRSFGLPQVAIERNGNNALLRSYTYGLDLLSEKAGNSTYWYHHDGLGSVADVTTNTGTSVMWTEYYPYGLIRQQGKAGGGGGAPAVQPFNFTGEQLDSVTGLYHLRARQYDPGTGRFLSTDPAAMAAADPYVSAYGYVNGNPTRYTDPSGNCIQFLAAAGAGVATGLGEAVIGPVSFALFGACLLFVAVAVKTVAQTAAQVSSSDRWYPEPGANSFFKGATRRELEKELRDAGYLPKPGSGRGGEQVWQRESGGPIVSLPRHKDISPGVTRNVRETLRNLDKFQGDSSSIFGQNGLSSNGK